MNQIPPRPSIDASPVEPPACARQLEEAFARWQGELLGTLYYLVGNMEDARDVLQEAFVKAWKQREQVAEIQNLKAWIFRIALNTGRDLRASAWRRRKQGLPDDEGLLPAISDIPVDVLSRQEELQALRVAIAGLRGEEQEVFLLRQNGELTYEEIAVELNLPVGTVKTRMRLAIMKLRAAMVEV